MGAVRRLVPESRERRAALGGLLAILLVGAIVRALFMVAWSPAFMGWPDAKSYIDVSQSELFGNPLRPAGYPIFLVVLNAIWMNIHFVIVVNHLLGLATAVILYATVVRAGGPRLLGLVPAAIVALGGDQMFLEHSVLSETLFTFLTACGVYAAVRCVAPGGGRTLPWAALSGVSLALATSVRVVGMATIVIVCVWMLFGARGELRRRVLTGVVAALGALAVLGSYWIAEYSSTGAVGMSRNGDYHLYGRVAPFADCTKFTPPPGTEMLCETTPRSERPITDAYIFSYWHSPAVRAFGSPFDAPGYQALVGKNILLNPNFQSHAIDSLQRYYGWHESDYKKHNGMLAALRHYERFTRIQGIVFVALALASFAGPLLTRGRERRAALLMWLVAWCLLTAPVASLEFSSRTAVPGFGFLGMSAALGGFAVARAWRERRAARGTPSRGAGLQPEIAG